MDVLARLALERGVTIDELQGRSRRKRIATIRRDIAAQLHDEYDLSLVEVGELLGRDDSTISTLVRGRRRRQVA